MDANDDTLGLCRVTERTHKIEDGRDAQFLSRNSGVSHSRMVGHSEEETESMGFQEWSDILWFNIINLAANRFKNVGRSAC